MFFHSRTRANTDKPSSNNCLDQYQDTPKSVGLQVFDGKSYEVTKGHIRALPQAVWQVLTDYGQLTRVFPYLTKSVIVNQTDCTKIIQQEVQPLPPIPAVPYAVEVKETHQRLLEWRGLSNYIKVNRGYFSLELVDQKTTAVNYGMCIEGALLIPSAVIRHQLRIIMPQILQIIKTRAEVLCKE